MRKSWQNSILGPLLILIIAALAIVYSWHKHSHVPAEIPATQNSDTTLPHSVLHYPDCDPAKDGKDCDKPITTPCYSGNQYEKFITAIKSQGLQGVANGKLADGRQVFLYEGAANGAFLLLAVGVDAQHKSEACQIGAGENWHSGSTP